MVLATSQTARSAATTATATPRAESTEPSLPRWSARKDRAPMTRPAVPKRTALPIMVIRATAVREGCECTQWTVTEASRAPRYMPSQKPTKDKVSSTAPSRSPSIAGDGDDHEQQHVEEVHGDGSPTGRASWVREVGSPPGNGRRVLPTAQAEFAKIRSWRVKIAGGAGEGRPDHAGEDQ